MSDDDEIDKLYENAEFIMPPNILKEKAGEGGIPQHLIKSAQLYIRDNDIDYVPYASKIIKEIEKNLEQLQKSNDPDKQKKLMQIIIENIMHIKAHGGMFNYEIMSKIAGKTLTFLEDAEAINQDLFDIIEAHNVSIKLIISHNNKGDGGAEGKALNNELEKAIVRFKEKYGNQD